MCNRSIYSTNNILPMDGLVTYHGGVFPKEEAEDLFNRLLKTIAWQHDQTKVFGKTYITKRKVAWHGEQPFTYHYSGSTKTALPWTADLEAINSTVEEIIGLKFNACLLNLYHSGEEGMGWHSDNEKELFENGAIASVSLGAERKFSFKHRQSKERIDLWLEDGSLLLMQGETQRHWLHCLPPSKKILAPRINLTFRQMCN